LAEKARFVSRYGNYSVGAQSKIAEHFGTGEERVLKRRIDAQFHRSLVSDEDLALAIQSFHFTGLPFNEETNSNISPRFRVSVWDSEWARINEGWEEDEIALMIQKLRNDPGLGTDHVEVAATRAAEPFPNYDDLSIEDILSIVKLASIDPATVIAYEVENQNRKELLDRFAGVTADDDTVVVSAG
jgi:hypothetical protein